MISKKSSNNQHNYVEMTRMSYVSNTSVAVGFSFVAQLSSDGHFMVQADEYSKEEDGLYTVLLCLGTSGESS